MKLITPSLKLAEGHYDDLKNKPFFPSLTKFFSSGPIVAMVWQVSTDTKWTSKCDEANNNITAVSLSSISY